MTKQESFRGRIIYATSEVLKQVILEMCIKHGIKVLNKDKKSYDTLYVTNNYECFILQKDDLVIDGVNSKMQVSIDYQFLKLYSECSDTKFQEISDNRNKNNVVTKTVQPIIIEKAKPSINARDLFIKECKNSGLSMSSLATIFCVSESYIGSLINKYQNISDELYLKRVKQLKRISK